MQRAARRLTRAATAAALLVPAAFVYLAAPPASATVRTPAPVTTAAAPATEPAAAHPDTRAALGAAARQPYTVTMPAGADLSKLARREYGRAADWTVIYWANRHAIRWADQVRAGQRLRIVPLPRHIPRAPRQLAPPPPPPPAGAVVATSASSGAQTGSAPPTAAPVAAPVTTGGGGVGGAFGACVRMAENGGSYAWGTGDGGGAYQFQPGTWAAYGGDPGAWGSASPAEQDRVFMNALARGGQSNWSLYDGCSAGLSTAAATTGAAAPVTVTLDAVVTHRAWHGHRRLAAFRWALAQRGKWYAWGGTGPSVFDCSGLVMESWLHGGGVQLDRTTTGMLGGGRLVRVTGHPRKGDLAFFGTGHVELFDKWGWTYGAAHTGTRIGFHHWSQFWHPTVFMRIA